MIGIELDDVTMEKEMEAAVNDENLAVDSTFFIESQRENLEIEDVGSGSDELLGGAGLIRSLEGIEDVENTENDGNFANTSLKPPKKKKKNAVAAINKKHKSYQPAKCQICSKVLSSNYSLKEHIENVHEKKKRFSCDLCPKSFYRKPSLISHITYNHIFPNDHATNSNRPFKCDFKGCGKFFKTRADLKVHERVHSGKLLNLVSSFNSYLLLFSQIFVLSNVSVAEHTETQKLSEFIGAEFIIPVRF
jgi:Zinc finger, C2H2 type/GAGA factor